MAHLVIKDICKFYGDKAANDHISLEVPENRIFGLLGPNGAGKTTLIRIITNIIGADSGTVFFKGQPLKRKHQSRLGYMPEERGLYKKMKVGEQLIYLAQLKDLSKKEAMNRIGMWLEKFEISDWWNKKVEELSKGMQQKLQFIATVVHDPELLILDEPFSGLDPINTNLIKNEIHELKMKGTTIIFSTHRMEQVEEICEQIALINDGKNILEGSVAEIKQQHKESKYSVRYSGEIPETLGKDIEMVDRFDHQMILKLRDGMSSNQLLNQLMGHGLEIVSFNEVLPTINQIFINKVSQ